MRRCILGVVIGCGLALLVPKETIAQSPRTTRVSVAPGGAQATGGRAGSGSPALSADGRYAAFTSEATNLVDGDLNGVRDVFVHDRQTGTTTRVSVVTGGAEANGVSNDPSISADGRFVACEVSTNEAASNDNLVLVWEALSGSNQVVSLDTSGQALGPAWAPSMAPDGSTVAFLSSAPHR